MKVMRMSTTGRALNKNIFINEMSENPHIILWKILKLNFIITSYNEDYFREFISVIARQ